MAILYYSLSLRTKSGPLISQEKIANYMKTYWIPIPRWPRKWILLNQIPKREKHEQSIAQWTMICIKPLPFHKKMGAKIPSINNKTHIYSNLDSTPRASNRVLRSWNTSKSGKQNRQTTKNWHMHLGNFSWPVCKDLHRSTTGATIKIPCLRWDTLSTDTIWGSKHALY